MSVSMQPPNDPEDVDVARECERDECDGSASTGREVSPDSVEGAALGLDEPAYLCRDCLARLERALAGWSR